MELAKQPQAFSCCCNSSSRIQYTSFPTRPQSYNAFEGIYTDFHYHVLCLIRQCLTSRT